MSENLSGVTQKKREYSIDIIRGIAVFLMILAHAIDFYHDGSNTFLRFIVMCVNVIVFTVFLFLSGAITSLVYLHRPKTKKLTRSILKRVIVLLISYYILAFISQLDKFYIGSLSDKLNLIFNTFTLKIVPSYTEFLIPFIIFSLTVIPFSKILDKTSKHLSITIIASVLFYVAGYTLYQLNLPEYLSPWKAILSGHDNVYRFPILQYSPIFFLGLRFGKWLIDNPNPKERRFFFGISTLSLFSVFCFILIIYLSLSLDKTEILRRWPPSLIFLLIGLVSTTAIFYLLFKKRELKKQPFIRDFLLLLGQNAFALYCAHIAILKLYRLSGGTVVSSPVIVFFLFIILLVTSLTLVTFIPFNFSFHLTFIRDNSGKPFLSYSTQAIPTIFQLSEDIQHKPKLRYRILYVILGILLCLGTFSSFDIVKEKISAKPTKINQWWDLNYPYRKGITITNDEKFRDAIAVSKVTLTLNHRQLVSLKKSRPDGKDISIIYNDGNRFVELPYAARTPWNNDATILNFSLQKNISSGSKSQNYQLYYGDLLDEKSPEIPSFTNDLEIQSTLGEEKTYQYFSTIDKVWNLKDEPCNITEPLTFNLEVLDRKLDNPSVHYEIIGTKVSGQMEQIPGGIWQASINIGNLDPGSYRIKAKITEKNKSSYSSSSVFKVSYPLYIAWTWDWEGYDVSDSHLQSMEYLSAKHNIPLTHFFNPRLFITNTISQSRKDRLVDWIKNRRDNKSEEIDLHLHMFNDWIEYCGITPDNSKRWGSYDDGYDILTTNYNYDQMLTMLNHSIKLFQENGFGMPLAYRAGGWYANMNTLRAVQDSGIKVDSSARTLYQFGAKKQPGFWDIKSTTKPYYPSLNDQNSSKAPNLSLLEIPNNGADSFKFSSSQMIKRFTDNYNGSPLLERQQIAYLSHPHWFNRKEQQTVDELFTHIDQYLNRLDQGPVVYVLTRDIYNVWTKSK